MVLTSNVLMCVIVCVRKEVVLFTWTETWKGRKQRRSAALNPDILIDSRLLSSHDHNAHEDSHESHYNGLSLNTIKLIQKQASAWRRNKIIREKMSHVGTACLVYQSRVGLGSITNRRHSSLLMFIVAIATSSSSFSSSPEHVLILTPLLVY